ncbi:DUF5682 family protein [Baaleninema simplex]|uniref:DUF5682 family protein n=1 Tax=Baaleninema simplex TaxID=2862350 RepID=UPI00034CBED8|nr:DUF5682 family protein [Baaleninema simplex]
MTVRIFGIRHHGPGSARSVLQAFNTWKPDAILIEGPPEAEPILSLAARRDMVPPVALLLYVRDRPHQAVYYPFAVYSPEWQSLRYGLERDVPVQLIDLPQQHRFPLQEMPPREVPETVKQIRRDPLGQLARAAGYTDGERWWEAIVEQRRDASDLFEGILEAMTALRERLHWLEDIEAMREAYMRKTIRKAQKAGFDRIAVVCGAWHAPALAQMPPAKVDNALLKGLPKTSVCATWVPWTDDRLCDRGGYGAGVASPGWYRHLWEVGNLPVSDVAVRWMARVAEFLRDRGLEASSAGVIEAVRLAEALAALRDRPVPGLEDLNDATTAVMGKGSEVSMRLVWEQLIVGDRIGEVPSEVPTTPLQQNLRDLQKRLRLKPEATAKTLALDLRKPLDLERSHLLHRLKLLGIPWGQPQRADGLGTFKEVWELVWRPELEVALVEASVWGNTIEDAAADCGSQRAQTAETLPQLTELLDEVLLAALPQVVPSVLDRVETVSTETSDVACLLEALPALARVRRYGNVRQTDTAAIARVLERSIVRCCLELPGACVSLDDGAARSRFQQIWTAHGAIALLQRDDYRRQWWNALQTLLDRDRVPGLIRGGSCRLLFDSGAIDVETTSRYTSLALSRANEPTQSAAWVEGFLQQSGLLLVHDDRLLEILDTWLRSLSEDAFIAVLPLLRRTFAHFTSAERRQLGQLLRGEERSSAQKSTGLDGDRADAVLPGLEMLLGQ